MATCYQLDNEGYLIAEADDFGGFLPAGAIYNAPPSAKDGHIRRWTGKKWEQVETHKGEEGYLDGKPHKIMEHGPLPAGWSDTPPLPTLEEAVIQAQAALREQRKTIEYGGFELDGQHWDSAEKDELRLNSVTKIFESGIPQYEGWKIADGVYITLTPELVQQAAMALMQHYGRCFAVEAAKLAEIAAMQAAGAAAIEAAEAPAEKKAAEDAAVTGVRAWQETQLTQGW